MSKKAMFFMAVGLGMGVYAFKNKDKIKRIMTDMKDIMQEEKYMLNMK